MAKVCEHPIPLNTEMVRAILSGCKTQTRRPLKPQPHDVEGMPIIEWPIAASDSLATKFCPYGAPGDRLWVREPWFISSTDVGTVSIGYGARIPAGKTLLDTDGGLDVIRVEDDVWRWANDRIDSEHLCPPGNMPRWASRITLEITEVRVQRVQDITEEDAQCEGFRGPFTGTDWCGINQIGRAPSQCFHVLWDSIYSGIGRGWHVNPWVWVIGFKRLEASSC